MSKHILMVSAHCCIRVRKQAQALKDKGYIVDSVSHERPHDVSVFNKFIVSPKFNDMWKDIKRSPSDIIHVHNEPDSLMYQADKGANGRPIIYDCHDLEWYRFGTVRPQEEFAFKRADGIVHVSEEHGQKAWDLHPWDCPDTLIYSCPPKSWIPKIENSTREGVVYQGGLSIPGETRFNWRDHSKLAEAFKIAEIPLDFYAAEFYKRYYPRHKGYLPYFQLLERLHNYKYGFVGTAEYTEKGLVCVPNKMWEYAACGVVPIIMNFPAALKVFGPGTIHADSLKEIIPMIREANYEELKSQMVPRYMDDEIIKLEELYNHLL